MGCQLTGLPSAPRSTFWWCFLALSRPFVGLGGEATPAGSHRQELIDDSGELLGRAALMHGDDVLVAGALPSPLLPHRCCGSGLSQWACRLAVTMWDRTSVAGLR